MIKLEAQIAQNKKDQEKLSEEGERLRGELEKLDEPELRPGDYGIVGLRREAIHHTAFTVEKDGRIVYENGGWNIGSTFYDNVYYIHTRLGNIFDDLERNREYLRSFDIEGRHFEQNSRLDIGRAAAPKDYVYLGITNAKVYKRLVVHFNLDEATEIHQNLGRVIATIKRGNNDWQRESSSTN